MTRMAGAILLGLCCAHSALGRAAPVTVIPVAAEKETLALQHVVTEMALRCPAARHLRYDAIAPQLPRFARITAGAAEPPLPPDLLALEQDFFRSEDFAGAAVRFTRAARELEADPVALLSFPSRRAQLWKAHLFAARALLQAGEVAQAQVVLGTVAVRLADLAGPPTAEWGPNLALLDQQVRATLPPPEREVSIEGPAGWAVHVDEQPLGALPRQTTRLRPGRHAVVAIGLDGTAVSWLLDLNQVAAGPVHLVADRQLEALCPVAGMMGLCGELGPQGTAALARFLDGDLIFIRQTGSRIEGWRHREGRPASPIASVPVGGGDQATALLAHTLCRYEPPAAVPRGAAVASIRAGPPARRRQAWPGATLLGAGLLLGILATPYFVYDGRCVDNDCARVYDFHLLAPSLIGAGAAMAIGGAIWLGLALR